MNMVCKMDMATKNRITGLVMTLPAILILMATVVYPIVWSFIISISDSNSVFQNHFDIVWAQNYATLLKSSAYLNALKNTISFVVVTLSCELIIGFIVALILNSQIAGHKVFRLIFTFPLMISPLVGGLQFRWLLADQYGALNNLLALFNIEGPLWLTTPIMSFISLIMVNVWLATPFCSMVLLSALATLPESLNEAGRLDGANIWQIFLYVTLPQLRSAVLTILVVRIADAFRVFDIVYILTSGGPGTSTEMLSNYIYKTSFNRLQFGEGAAASFTCMFIVGVICFMLFKFLGKIEEDV